MIYFLITKDLIDAPQANQEERISLKELKKARNFDKFEDFVEKKQEIVLKQTKKVVRIFSFFHVILDSENIRKQSC